MKKLTIGEVANLADVQTSAIRYYESEGLIPEPDRINGRRVYDPDVLKRLGLIQLLRQTGFGIRELQAMFTRTEGDSPGDQWRTLAANKIVEMDALIERTQATRAWLAEALATNCHKVDDCVQITFDENNDGMNVTLACMLSGEEKSESQQSLKLMSIQHPFQSPDSRCENESNGQG